MSLSEAEPIYHHVQLKFIFVFPTQEEQTAKVLESEMKFYNIRKVTGKSLSSAINISFYISTTRSTGTTVLVLQSSVDDIKFSSHQH